MSIKIKLIAVFSLLFFIVVAIVVYSRINISMSAALIEQTYDKPLMASNFARDSLVGFLRLQKNVANGGYDKAAFQKLFGDVSSSLDVVQERLVSEKSQPFLDKSRELLKQWADEITAGDLAKARDTGAAFESETDLLIENEFSAAHDYVIDTRAKVDHYNTVLLIMNGICLLVSFAGGLYLFLSIYRPIKSSIAISKKIAGGDFDSEIPVQGSLEFRHLLAALKEMRAKLILHIEERQQVLNCLGQGFFMFGRDGICTPVYSRSCQTLLETTPPGKHIADVLRLDAGEKKKFERLLRLVFDGGNIVSVDLLANFAPHEFHHSQNMHVRVDYMPAPVAAGQALDCVIVIATDITKQVQALALAETQKNAFESIERVLRDRRAFGAFMRRAMEFADTLSGDIEPDDLAETRREAHTLKGGAGVFRLTALAETLHDLESALSPEVPAATDASQIERIGESVKKEIASIRDQFTELLGMDVTKLDAGRHPDKNAALAFAGYLAARGLDDLRHEYIRRVCMESFRESFKHFDIQLEDLAARFNKKIYPIRFAGADVRLFTEGYKRMLESFVHIFRNIMDHGIELPGERHERGKDESGQVEIRSEVIGDRAGQQWLQIEIKDDGAGIDIKKVREKLHARDPVGQWLECSDQKILDQLLTEGVSTNKSVTHYSGRGIGLNAVYREVQKLGGSIAIHSVPGLGTRFSIKVPYIADMTSVA